MKHIAIVESFEDTQGPNVLRPNELKEVIEDGFGERVIEVVETFNGEITEWIAHQLLHMNLIEIAEVQLACAQQGIELAIGTGTIETEVTQRR